ncbi:MAG: selenocysteine-specific translation elongation factor [Limisphaerales bacterium]
MWVAKPVVISRESHSMLRHYILATAGHVDHGKSSLVRALTGVDPDRLPEEKARGITIELGFAHLTIEEAEGRHSDGSDVFDLGIVDVPGHEDFVKNMVAGVGSVDIALLVVSADDGWMPQTEEHLQILTYLGVKHCVVALSKVDRTQDLEGAIREVRHRLSGSPFESAAIVPTAVHDGRGVEALKQAILDVLRTIPAPPDIGKPRLSVDRVFVVRGTGTVVTGTLTGGQLGKGDSVCISTRGVESRIRSIQSHSLNLDRARPGQRVALNLADVDATKEVARGDVITLPPFAGSSCVWEVELGKSGRLLREKVPASRPLQHGSQVWVHLGSARVKAKVRLPAGASLKPGQISFGQLRLQSALPAFVGDRFILRDASERNTLAGGTVLAMDGVDRGWNRTLYQESLSRLGAAIGSPGQLVEALVAQRCATVQQNLLVQSKYSQQEIQAAVRILLEAGTIVEWEGWLFDQNWWIGLVELGVRFVETFHASHPELPGVRLSELKSVIQRESKMPEVFEGVLGALAARGMTIEGHTIRRTSFQPSLPAHLRLAAERLKLQLVQRGLEVPSAKDLAPDAESRHALAYLVRCGDAVQLGADIVVSHAAFTQARITIRRFLRLHGKATTSDLRQALRSNRRVTIPLLEQLDKTGLTQRDGDFRFLR